MPNTEIHNWLVIDWKQGTTRTRATKPSPTELGTNEIVTEVELDVFIPEPQVETLTARVEVPEPRVMETSLDDLDAEDVDDWQDVADQELDHFADDYVLSWDTWAAERSDYLLRIVDKAPGRPAVEDVREYCDDWVRENLHEVEA